MPSGRLSRDTARSVAGLGIIITIVVRGCVASVHTVSRQKSGQAPPLPRHQPSDITTTPKWPPYSNLHKTRKNGYFTVIRTPFNWKSSEESSIQSSIACGDLYVSSIRPLILVNCGLVQHPRKQCPPDCIKLQRTSQLLSTPSNRKATDSYGYGNTLYSNAYEKESWNQLVGTTKRTQWGRQKGQHTDHIEGLTPSLGPQKAASPSNRAQSEDCQGKASICQTMATTYTAIASRKLSLLCHASLPRPRHRHYTNALLLRQSSATSVACKIYLLTSFHGYSDCLTRNIGAIWSILSLI